MITLITGLPGAGKTLFALALIKAYSERETRQVYYAGITDLVLPWTLFEPETWYSLPPGSIIVIDECQTVFPKKPNGSKLPEFYEKLAVHRHRGLDIFLITQHPSLVDNFVRQLVGRHFHSVRKFGLQRSTVYEWSAASASPQLPASQKTAIPLKWSYPKEVFGYYKSAEVHTVKRSIPAKLILGVLFVFAVLFGGWYALDRYQKRYANPASGQAPVSSSRVGSSSPGGRLSPLDDARAFVHSTTPRVVGLPHTAPKYDQITKPVRAPIPAMCIATSTRCKCFSQHSTKMDVSDLVCRDIAANGYFVDFNPDAQANQNDRDGVSSLSGGGSDQSLQVVTIPYARSDFNISLNK